MLPIQGTDFNPHSYSLIYHIVSDFFCFSLLISDFCVTGSEINPKILACGEHIKNTSWIEEPFQESWLSSRVVTVTIHSSSADATVMNSWGMTQKKFLCNAFCRHVAGVMSISPLTACGTSWGFWKSPFKSPFLNEFSLTRCLKSKNNKALFSCG